MSLPLPDNGYVHFKMLIWGEIGGMSRFSEEDKRVARSALQCLIEGTAVNPKLFDKFKSAELRERIRTVENIMMSPEHHTPTGYCGRAINKVFIDQLKRRVQNLPAEDEVVSAVALEREVPQSGPGSDSEWSLFAFIDSVSNYLFG